jgi:hypothetical protein
MREVTVTASGVSGQTTPVVLDQYIAPFQVSYVNSGTGVVQVTYTDPYPVVNQNFTEATFVWVTGPTGGFISQPVRAVRINGGVTGDTLTIVQSGVK